MKTATHEHVSKAFKGFKYLVTNNRAYMLIDNSWKRSTIDLKDLRPIGTGVEEPALTKSLLLIARNKATNKEILYNSISEAVSAGFSRTSISQCLSGDQNLHKGYEWRAAV